MSGIKDVAKRAGVSISTVSNVLNKSRYVSPELVDRVNAAVEELSYEANPVARSMKNNRSGTIGVITEDICGLFYPYIIKGINEVATEKGYQVMLCDVRGTYGDLSAIEREKAYFHKLIGARVDGIIFASTISDNEKQQYFSVLKRAACQHKYVPLISLERDFTAAGIDSVYFDSFGNAILAVQHLYDCGCRTIAHITGPENLVIAQDRVKGYKKCLMEHGLAVDDSLIAEGDFSHQSGYLAMKILIERRSDIDSVFCANDQMAVGALKYLKECGKRVPDDIRLMGYDDVFLASVMDPSISTVHIYKHHAGKEAARILFERIENQPGCEETPVGIKVQSKLVARQSTGAVAPEDWILADW